MSRTVLSRRLAARRMIELPRPQLTNQTLAAHLRDFIQRFHTVREELKLGNRLDGGIDLIRLAADRLACDSAVGHRYQRSVITGICKCGRPYRDHLRCVSENPQ